MIHELTLPAPIPAKKNSRRNFGKVSLPSKQYLDWHSSVINNLPMPSQPFLRCKLSIIYHIGDKRKRDLDNTLSSILDLLCDAGIIVDDSWTVVEQINISSVYEKGIWFADVKLESL